MRALDGLTLSADQRTVLTAAANEVAPAQRDEFYEYVGERLRHWSRIRDDQVHTAIGDALHIHGGAAA